MAKEIRTVYGEALVKYGKENKNIVVLDADVCGSTKTCLFRDAFPERFFNVGIAEANMTAIAAGLATVGKIPFVNTFAAFLTTLGLLPSRAYGSYDKLPIKLMGAYGGMSDAFDGPTHHSLEDIAIMRSLPNFKVYVAGDATSTDWLVKHALEDPSPMYIRLSRNAFVDLYDAQTVFEDGKGNVVKDGSDATVVACGYMVGNSLEAAKLLKDEGISVRVVDMFSIKPIDSELLLSSARETGAIITAEEHSIIGGLGAAVAEVLSEANAKVPLGRVGTLDRHAETGPYPKLIEKYGLSPKAIAAKVLETIKKKSQA
ncbi:MAG TPA: transketolase C-terminal domain-containing protein [Clostridia bacterium]|nr:transketolase C-terminal domain-containing protein [Clostridia bacterium]HOR13030.1 transketolase C-terminal domain-containing protein [Clostridia bacterium]